MTPSFMRNLTLASLTWLVALGCPALADTNQKTYKAFSQYTIAARFPSLKKRIEALVLQISDSPTRIWKSRFLFKDGDITYQWTAMTDLSITLRKPMSVAEATRLAGLLSWHKGHRPVGKLKPREGALSYSFPSPSEDGGEEILITRKGDKATSVTYSMWGP